MKFTTVVLVLLGLIAATVGLYFATYDWQFNALRNEIRKHEQLKILKSWKHQDISLEDFAFTVSSGEWELELNIFDGSRVRTPRDHARGLVVKWEPRAREMDVVTFDSAYWKARGLPPIKDMAGFLKASDQILNTLAASPPETKTTETYPWPNYLDHLYIVIQKKPGGSRAE